MVSLPVSARNFEDDDLYVHYFVELPTGKSANVDSIYKLFKHGTIATDISDFKKDWS